MLATLLLFLSLLFSQDPDVAAHEAHTRAAEREVMRPGRGRDQREEEHECQPEPHNYENLLREHVHRKHACVQQ